MCGHASLAGLHWGATLHVLTSEKGGTLNQEIILRGRRVLLVDDSVIHLDTAAPWLRHNGYEVITADSGARALEILDSQSFDCVVLDLEMPGMSGYELCAAIRSNPAVRDIPLAILTASEDTESLVAGIRARADDFIAKSAGFEVLEVRIAALIRRRRVELENKEISERLRRSEAEAERALNVRRQAEARAALLAELKLRNTELEQARDELLAARQRREELISLLVHDLRNPLTGILSAARYLSSANRFDEEARQSVRDLLHASESMLRMVHDLLDLSRSENGALVLKPTEFDLAELVRELCNLMRRDTAGVPHEISAAIDPVVIRVFADYDLVRRVIANLISNGLSFTTARKVLSVQVSGNGEQSVELAVRDQGPGVLPEHRERIFDMNVALEVAGGPVRRGRGMGLTFCRMAARAHGGDVWVNDQLTSGAEFRMRLPRQQPPR